MLEVEGLAAGYGETQVLFDVSLTVGAGEVLALLGRNGMGKTTTISAIVGLLPVWSGDLRFAGQPIAGLPPFRIAQRGLGLVPEGRQIFPTLTVEENLVATATRRGAAAPRWTLDPVWSLFPRLKERRTNLGSQLSGGEQQMLAIGRALMTNPTLLILDEATEGLAPVIPRRDLGRSRDPERRGTVHPADRQEPVRGAAAGRPSGGGREGGVGVGGGRVRTSRVRRKCGIPTCMFERSGTIAGTN